jgi:WD40 repeat protein
MINKFKGHSAKIKGALVLQNGHLLSWSNDRDLRIWSLDDGSQLKILRGHESYVVGALELSDGRLVSWSGDATIIIWDKHESKISSKLCGHTGAIGGVILIGNDRLLSWSGNAENYKKNFGDKKLCMWELNSGRLIWSVVAHKFNIQGAILLLSGSILSWSIDGTLARWNIDDGKLERRYEGHTFWVMGVFQLDNSRLVSWSQDDTIRLWNIEDGANIVVEEVARSVWSGSRIDTNRFAIWSDGLTIFDVRDLSRPIRLEGHAQSTIGALFISESQLVTWSVDETLRSWDISAVDMPKKILPPIPGNVLTPCTDGFGQDHLEWVRGALKLGNGDVVSWSYDHSLRLWDVETGSTKSVLSGHKYWVHGVLEIPEQRLISWSDDCDVNVWDIPSSALLATLQGSTPVGKKRAWKDAGTHDNFVSGVILVNPNSIISWDEDGIIKLWDLKTLKEVRSIELDSLPDGIHNLDHDCFYLWFEREDKVEIWSVLSCTLISKLTVNEFNKAYPAQAIALSQDGKIDKDCFITSELSVSVDKGILKMSHKLHGDMYWHGNRVMEFFCLPRPNCICMGLSEKELGFIRVELPN